MSDSEPQKMKVKPHIEAQVRLLRTDEGGRKTPANSGYRPQFYYAGQNWDAICYFKNEQLALGATDLCRIVFASPESLLPTLFVDARFELREGARIVAEGVVTRLLKDDGEVIEVPHPPPRGPQAMSESESEKPKRKFWQFHLTTAFLIMMTASGFVWINCVREDDAWDYGDERYLYWHYGWPTEIFCVQNDWDFSRKKDGGKVVSTHIYLSGIVKNVTVLILALGILAFISEYLIRRREGRKP
jgi:hypothetical protein